MILHQSASAQNTKPVWPLQPAQLVSPVPAVQKDAEARGYPSRGEGAGLEASIALA